MKPHQYKKRESSYSKKSTNKYRRKHGAKKKSLFGHQGMITDSAKKHQQILKTSWWRCAEQQDIYPISSISYIVTDYKRKMVRLEYWFSEAGAGGEVSPSRGHLVKSADIVVVTARVTILLASRG